MLPSNKKNISILIIGSEITQGFVRDSNTQFFTSELYREGIPVREIITVPDDPKAIKSAIRLLQKSGDFIITTGGLGPTDDDLTVDILCEILEVKTESVKSCEERVSKLFTGRDNEIASTRFKRIMRQCRIPGGTEALPNQAGLAPGIYSEKLSLISLPGFPVEIKSIWPFALKKIMAVVKPSFYTRNFSIWGIPESHIYDCLKIPEGIEYGNHSLPWGNRLFLRSGIEEKENLDKVSREIKSRFKAHMLENPVDRWFLYLKKNKITFSTIESCTGGLGAKLFTDIPGVSAFYPGSIVSYSNEIKEKVLQVNKNTIKRFGAVSRETAREMALGGGKLLSSDITISITGIAGPGGGTKEKPVGTVYYGIFDRREKLLYSGSGFFPFGRERFRNAAIYNIFLSLYHRYVFFKSETKWLSSPQGKNFLKESIIASSYF